MTHIITEPAEAKQLGYHGHPAVSRSMLVTFRKSRRLFYKRHILRETPDEPETGAMIKGTAGHACILEGKPLDSCYTLIPPEALNKDGHKKGAAWKDFAAAHAGEPLLKQDEVDEAIGSVRSILEHPDFKKLSVLPSKREHEIYWQADNGIDLRMRLDWMIELPKFIIVWDFKFTNDASPAAFFHRIRGSRTETGLWFQAAMYSDGVEKTYGKPVLFYFWAVDNQEPYRCVPHTLSEGSMKTAKAAYLRTLDQLEHCLDTNDFSDPCEKIVNTHDIDDRAFEDLPEVKEQMNERERNAATAG